MLIPSQFVASTKFLSAAAPLSAALFSEHSMSMMSSGPPQPSMSSLAIPVALSVARGGAELFAGSKALDIGRVRMRLEGLQAYATLCALLTNGCLRLYSSVKVPKSEAMEGTNESTRIALDVFLLSIIVSVLFGSYTTVVFGLLALYSKTALGRGYDQQFLAFWAATAELRESGFHSFLYSLVSFELAFILSLFLRFQGRRRKMLVLVACIISGVSLRRWSSIMHLAETFLFPLKAEIEY